MIDPKHSWIGQVDHSLFLRNAAVDGALLKMLYTQKIIKNETFLTRKNGDRLAVGTVEVAQLIILAAQQEKAIDSARTDLCSACPWATFLRPML